MFKKSNLILQNAIALHWALIKKATKGESFPEKKPIHNMLSLGLVLFSMVASAQTTTTTRTYNYTGSSQIFTIPAGVTTMTVEAWGAGGAGGGGSTTAARGAGGGGAYTRFPLSVTAGQVYTINVGAGGLGNSNPGGTGGASNITLGSTVKINAAGGAGGSSGSGGAGGQLSASVPTTGTGLVRTSGGNGGGSSSGNGGAGGGSAGTGGNGGNGGSGGSIGAAGLGTNGNVGAAGGSGGLIALLGLVSSSGTIGGSPGAGGGGRSGSLLTGTLNGGAGANGKIIITYTISTSDLSVTKTVSNASPAVGDAVTFTITAKNNRAFSVSDVIATDLLPTGYTFLSASLSGYDKTTGQWKIGTLASNASTVLTITGLINPTGDYNNTATILSETMPDDVPGNNSATAIVTVCKAGTTAPQVNP